MLILEKEQLIFVLDAPQDERSTLLSFLPSYYSLLSGLSTNQRSQFCKLPADHQRLALTCTSLDKFKMISNLQDLKLLLSISDKERAYLLTMPEQHSALLMQLSADERRAFMQANQVNFFLFIYLFFIDLFLFFIYFLIIYKTVFVF
jgi:hypothetical protein